MKRSTLQKRNLPSPLFVLVLCLLSGLATLAQERVRAIEPPRQPLPAESASAGITRFSFLAYGDTRGRKDGSELQFEHSLVVEEMLSVIRERKATPYPVRFILQSGDAVDDGRNSKQWNVSFVPLINRLTAEGGVPYFLAPGNHDVTSAAQGDAPQRKEGLQHTLAAISNLIPSDGAPRRLRGYPTYSFGYGNTFVIALDSNIASDQRQYEWVKAQLGGLDRKRYLNVVVFFHHPPFSSGPHGGSKVEAPTAALRQLYLPLFRAHRVKLTLSGHDHLFEHWVERYTDASGETRRLDHVVSGGGGAPIYTYQGEPNLSQYLQANRTSKVQLEHLVKPGPNRGDNPHHFVVVQVDGEQLRMEVLGVDWGSNFRPYRSNRIQLQDP